jgi:hypothetical protein
MNATFSLKTSTLGFAAANKNTIYAAANPQNWQTVNSLQKPSATEADGREGNKVRRLEQ